MKEGATRDSRRETRDTQGSQLIQTGNMQESPNKAGIAALDLPELYQCVHCGLCLNQCPTYRALRLEPESPRGRIHLVKAAADGRIELSERFKDHLYLCLLCRACETACPSGVQYGRIAETAREIIGPPGSQGCVPFSTSLLPSSSLIPEASQSSWQVCCAYISEPAYNE